MLGRFPFEHDYSKCLNKFEDFISNSIFPTHEKIFSSPCKHCAWKATTFFLCWQLLALHENKHTQKSSSQTRTMTRWDNFRFKVCISFSVSLSLCSVSFSWNVHKITARMRKTPTTMYCGRPNIPGILASLLVSGGMAVLTVSTRH